MNDMLSFEPIGYVSAHQKYKYQQPRQGEFARNRGVIQLLPGNNYEQALEDLEQFDKIWLIYLFHQNSGWRPKVNPPVSPDGKKKGVFATRSPYRPNPIGMSCVDLVSVDGLKLTIENFDLLDETPILDIKPYIAHYDAHPTASTGWLPENPPAENEIIFAPAAEGEGNWIIDNGGPDLFDLVRVQLAIDPFNTKRKRITLLDENRAVLAFRTWRIQYELNDAVLTVEAIRSGYSAEELVPGSDDRYRDKDLHRGFRALFRDH